MALAYQPYWGMLVIGIITIALLLLLAYRMCRGLRREHDSTSRVVYRAATPARTRSRRSWRFQPVSEQISPPNPPPTPELMRSECCSPKVIDERASETTSF